MAEQKRTSRLETSPGPGDRDAELSALREENARLSARVAELEAADPAAARRAAAPAPPSFGMSEGVRVELAERGISSDPYSRETLNALDEGIVPGNADAQRRAERDRAERAKAAPDTAPRHGRDVEV